VPKKNKVRRSLLHPRSFSTSHFEVPTFVIVFEFLLSVIVLSSTLLLSNDKQLPAVLLPVQPLLSPSVPMRLMKPLAP